VHTHRETTCPGGQVVPRQGALVPLVQAPLRCEGKGMGGNDGAICEDVRHVGRHGLHDQNRPSRTSNFVGLAIVGRPAASQAACHEINVPALTGG